MLNKSISGQIPRVLLVEKAEEVLASCYIGISQNPENFNLVITVSPRGGVDVERAAIKKPEDFLHIELPENDRNLSKDTAEKLADFVKTNIGVEELQTKDLQNVISRLFSGFQQYDCRLAEINPLGILKRGHLCALDAKFVLDNNAIQRQSELLQMLGISAKRHDLSEVSVDESRASDAGFPYVDLLPNKPAKDPDKLYVGLVPGGAGYGIWSIDEVTNIGNEHFGGQPIPINFMDSGGGPTERQVEEMFGLLMDNELCDLIVTSRFGGISSCAVFIKGLVQCLRNRKAEGRRIIPVYGRMVGTDIASADRFLKQAIRVSPEALIKLKMITGNEKTMSEVIQEAIAFGMDNRI